MLFLGQPQYAYQARSQEFLKAGEVSGNQGTNFRQFGKSKLNVSIKVRFFQKNHSLSNTNNFIKYPNLGIQFHDKKNSQQLKYFTSENKRYVYLPILYNGPSLSRGHQTITIMSHYCYCFDVLWKKRAKHILLLNALLQKAREASYHPVLVGNWPTCSYMTWP